MNKKTQALNEAALMKVASFSERVRAARERWEQGTYATSNAELYAMLADCLDFFIEVTNNRRIANALNEYLRIEKITHNAKTSLELKVVRLVFSSNGNEEKIANRLHSYARVIRIAYTKGVKGEKLAEFIEENNGIEEIKRVSKSGLTKAEERTQHKESAKIELFNEDGFENLRGFKLVDELKPVDGEQFSLALVRKNDDGTGSIVYGTNNSAVVATVLALAGKEIKERVAKKAVEQHFYSAEEIKKRNFAELEQQLAKKSAKEEASKDTEFDYAAE